MAEANASGTSALHKSRVCTFDFEGFGAVRVPPNCFKLQAPQNLGLPLGESLLRLAPSRTAFLFWEGIPFVRRKVAPDSFV